MHSTSALSPLRRSSDSLWVHLQCTVYSGIKFINEAFLDKEDRFIPVKGLDNMDSSAFCLKCSICEGTTTGYCVNCSETTCILAFHPFCAIISGFKTDPPLISCKEHSSPQKTAEVKLQAHKIKEEKKIQIQQLHHFYRSRPLKKTKRSRNTKTLNDFHKVDEYFSSIPGKILAQSVIPFEKNSFALPVQKYRKNSKCRVLFQWLLKDFILSFRVNRRDHSAFKGSDDFIIIPKIGEPKELKYDLLLENYTVITKEQSIEYELLSRCLNETISAEDEVTKEILYSLEYFSRKIIPVVNTNKELISKMIGRGNKLDMAQVHAISNES